MFRNADLFRNVPTNEVKVFESLKDLEKTYMTWASENGFLLIVRSSVPDKYIYLSCNRCGAPSPLAASRGDGNDGSAGLGEFFRSL